MRCPKCGHIITIMTTRKYDKATGKVLVKADFAGVQYFWCDGCVRIIKFRAG